jgi:fructose-bisphosphate aldolase, class II
MFAASGPAGEAARAPVGYSNREPKSPASRTESQMPIATPEIYNEMLDRAKAGGFAYPAINCTSSETVNAALKGFADAGSDGIIQFSTGGAEFGSGTAVKNMVTGAVALAEFAHVVAEKYSINVALHTDHCPKDKLDGYVRPLLALSAERVRAGANPLFQSHMWDGSAVPLDENLKIAAELLAAAAEARIILELEVGVVGGEEDGVANEINEKLYTSEGDYLQTLEALGSGEHGRYLLAATFGNVHGVYKPGNVKLRPDILAKGQQVASEKLGLPAGSKPFDLVFHGGSGSTLEEIREAVSYGVVKMNVDTDTQYAFTRPIVGHMFTNYDGVLKIDGEVGKKEAYNPRSYLKAAEAGMAARVVQACENLQSAGTAISGS